MQEDAALLATIPNPIDLFKLNGESVQDAIKGVVGKKISSKIYYEDVVPNVGSLEMSYAKFLDLLEQRLVRRIHILADGNVAVVEV